MQTVSTLHTQDIFKAAYILMNCECDITPLQVSNTPIVFDIWGYGVKEVSRIYSEGLAFCSLAEFKKQFYILLDHSGQAIRSIR